MCALAVKPGASGGSSSSQSLVSVKAQTTAGIVSKTISTVVQKRVAHTPTMKVSTCLLIDISYHYSLKVNLAISDLCRVVQWSAPSYPLSLEPKFPPTSASATSTLLSMNVSNSVHQRTLPSRRYETRPAERRGRNFHQSHFFSVSGPWWGKAGVWAQ